MYSQLLASSLPGPSCNIEVTVFLVPMLVLHTIFPYIYTVNRYNFSAAINDYLKLGLEYTLHML